MLKSYYVNLQGSTQQSSGSCDKKCSGAVSGLELAGERHTYTLDFSVKKGKVALKVLQVTSLATTTQPTPTASMPGGVNASAACPSGFRRVCSMVGSCPLGSKAVCPPGQQESDVEGLPSAADCRCVPFFLLGDLDRALSDAEVLDRLAPRNEILSISVEAVKLKLGSKTCTCSFVFFLTSSHQVSSSSGRCDKRCSGRGKGLEVQDDKGIISFDLTVKKGKAKVTNPSLISISTPATTFGISPTTNSVEPTPASSTDTGCLCVDQGPSKQNQLTFNETGQTFVQNQVFFEETGILGNLKHNAF